MIFYAWIFFKNIFMNYLKKLSVREEIRRKIGTLKEVKALLLLILGLWILANIFYFLEKLV